MFIISSYIIYLSSIFYIFYIHVLVLEIRCHFFKIVSLSAGVDKELNDFRVVVLSYKIERRVVPFDFFCSSQCLAAGEGDRRFAVHFGTP